MNVLEALAITAIPFLFIALLNGWASWQERRDNRAAAKREAERQRQAEFEKHLTPGDRRWLDDMAQLWEDR